MATHLRPISQAEPIPAATNQSSTIVGPHALARLNALDRATSTAILRPAGSPFKGMLACLRQFTRNSNHIALGVTMGGAKAVGPVATTRGELQVEAWPSL